jgi:hypothetical protein
MTLPEEEQREVKYDKLGAKRSCGDDERGSGAAHTLVKLLGVHVKASRLSEGMTVRE